MKKVKRSELGATWSKIFRQMAQASAQKRTVLWTDILHDWWGGFVNLQTSELIHYIDAFSSHRDSAQKFPIRLFASGSILHQLQHLPKHGGNIRVVRNKNALV